MNQTYRSRWGYHPCDYETYLCLKKLNRYFQQALRRFADWKRWSRKLPHNRVIRRRVVDAQGRWVGTEVVGPRPQPALCPVFCRRDKVVRHWSVDGKHSREGREVERVSLCHADIPEVYRAARTPALQPDQVVPLRYTAQEIRALVEQAEAWYGKPG